MEEQLPSMTPDPSETLATTAGSIKELAGRTANQLKEAAEAKAAELKAAAVEKVSQAKVFAENQLEVAKDHLGEFKEKVDSYVRNKPTQAVLTAMGLGFVLGLLFRK